MLDGYVVSYSLSIVYHYGIWFVSTKEKNDRKMNAEELQELETRVRKARFTMSQKASVLHDLIS